MKIGVIGGGIAGASAAFGLVSHPARPEVVLLEAERQLGQHTTGRSAAQYIENYGAPAIRPLTKASRSFFENPPERYSERPLLTPQPILTMGRPGQEETIDRLLEAGTAINPAIAEISLAEAARLVPALRVDRFTRALIEPDSSDIDVAELLQCFVRGFRAQGGTIATSRRVDAATPRSQSGAGWNLETTSGTVEVDMVVNAAGAWGDVVAATAGVAPVGLTPMRRTAFMVASRFEGSADWPMVADADLDWYVKPDGVQFLCSPAEENPSEPMDVKPEEIDVAIAIDRINEVTTLDIASVRSSWTGLRTFVPDRAMVLGPDPDHRSFVWCVGQGGNGIQTAPAAGRLVADLCLDGTPGVEFERFGLDRAALAPDRLRG
jgi:D-arginine dehydrogenase